LIKNRLGSHYITVPQEKGKRKNMGIFARSIRIVLILCMVVVVAVTGYSVADYIKEMRSVNTLPEFYDELNMVKKQYIVPVATDMIPQETAESCRPKGYSENIGTALAVQIYNNRMNAEQQYDVIIDTVALKNKFDASYVIVTTDGYVTYWSELTAYEKYLHEIQKIEDELNKGTIYKTEAETRRQQVKSEFLASMQDYTNALRAWEGEIHTRLRSFYTELADGKYYAKLLASEIHSLVKEGFLVYAVGNEYAGISEEYEKYFGMTDGALLWKLSQSSENEQFMLRYEFVLAAGRYELDEKRLGELVKEKLEADGRDRNAVVDGSWFVKKRSDAGKIETVIGCQMEITAEELERVISSNPEGELYYIFENEEQYADYYFAVLGDGFAYKTEFVAMKTEKQSA